MAPPVTTPSFSNSRRSGSKVVSVSSSLPHPLDRDLQRAGHAQRLDARIDPAQSDEPSRVTEILAVDRHVAPWGVVGDVADGRIDACGSAGCRQLPGRMADLLRGAIVLERQRQRQQGKKV